ncbi:MAG: methyltransferase domain-containing protein [Phycisphaerae bacterium]|jgi:glycosyltransferase involved in cell wall biosynthesis
MEYEGKIDLHDKNNSHTLAFERIEEYAAGRMLHVLEVGCSTGYFGAALIDRGHQVWGVEPYLPAAEKGREHLTGVFAGGIEEYFGSCPAKKFDVVVFGDVLEHLIDPKDVLVRSKAFLAENGIVIASVPNIAHFAVRAMLLEGRWDYTDRGILDRTHLRFYTRDSLVDLFSVANYFIDSIDTVTLSAEAVGELFAMNLKKESIAASTQFARDHRGTDFQYVVVARPGSKSGNCCADNIHIKAEKKLRILCLVHDVEASLVDIRLREPLTRRVRNNAGIFRVVSIHEYTVADLQWADVVVFQREASEYVLKLTDKLQAQGKKVVFEIDDYLLELPPFLGHHEKYLRHSRPYIVDLMRRADALSVSTPMLGNQLSAFNKNIHITPNYSKPNIAIGCHFSCQPQEVTLVLASSDSVLVDMLAEPLRRIQKQYGCRVIGIGPPGKFLARNGVCIRQVDIMGHADYCQFLSLLDNAIGVIPLDNSLFSSCKSAIKYFDYSMAGLPSVCSNVLPYSDVITSGVNGYLVDNATEAWTKILSELIEDSDLRSRISESARASVAEHYNLDLSAKGWSGVFKSLNIDFTRTRNCRASDLAISPSLKQIINKMFKYVVRPSSYIKALSSLRHGGMKMLYKKIVR